MSPSAARHIRQFASTLPATYRDRYDDDAVAQHARTAEERGAASVKIGTWSGSPRAGRAVCVVAEDRPGLLALITRAFITEGLDVVDADAFTRTPPHGPTEAVDLFWLRPATSDDAVTDELVARAETTLLRSLDDDESSLGVSPRDRVDHLEGETVVRFVDDEGGGLAVLEVETTDRSGLLHALTTALFEARTQILRSEVKTSGRRVRDRFHIVELDGRPIRDERRLELQVAILKSVDAEQTPASPEADVS